jgi:hypothetical protein
MRKRARKRRRERNKRKKEIEGRTGREEILDDDNKEEEYGD